MGAKVSLVKREDHRDQFKTRPEMAGGRKTVSVPATLFTGTVLVSIAAI